MQITWSIRLSLWSTRKVISFWSAPRWQSWFNMRCIGHKMKTLSMSTLWVVIVPTIKIHTIIKMDRIKQEIIWKMRDRLLTRKKIKREKIKKWQNIIITELAETRVQKVKKKTTGVDNQRLGLIQFFTTLNT